jgi:hypothetical protein
MGINDKIIYFQFPYCLPSIEVILLCNVINRIAVFENISKFNTYFIKNAFCFQKHAKHYDAGRFVLGRR